MNRGDLQRYPALEEAFDHRARGNRHAYLDELLEAERDGFCDAISHVDAALARLRADFSLADLDEQSRDLFGTERSWAKAETELLGLDHVHSHRQLTQIGWPADHGGASPFEGVMATPAGDVPFDIKSASSGDSQWLINALRPVAQQWAGTNDVTIQYRAGGVMTRQALGDYHRQLVTEFERKLNDLEPWDGVATAEVSVSAAGASFSVSILPTGDITVNTSHASAAGRALSIMATFRDHVSDKGVQCQKHGGVGFILVYVRPPGKGASDPSTFMEATQRLVGGALAIDHRELWLASAMIDWTRSFGATAQVHTVVNPSALWPNGLTSDSIQLLPCLR